MRGQSISTTSYQTADTESGTEAAQPVPVPSVPVPVDSALESKMRASLRVLVAVWLVGAVEHSAGTSSDFDVVSDSDSDSDSDGESSDGEREDSSLSSRRSSSSDSDDDDDDKSWASAASSLSRSRSRSRSTASASDDSSSLAKPQTPTSRQSLRHSGARDVAISLSALGDRTSTTDSKHASANRRRSSKRAAAGVDVESSNAIAQNAGAKAMSSRGRGSDSADDAAQAVVTAVLASNAPMQQSQRAAERDIALLVIPNSDVLKDRVRAVHRVLRDGVAIERLLQLPRAAIGTVLAVETLVLGGVLRVGRGGRSELESESSGESTANIRDADWSEACALADQEALDGGAEPATYSDDSAGHAPKGWRVGEQVQPWRHSVTAGASGSAIARGDSDSGATGRRTPSTDDTAAQIRRELRAIALGSDQLDPAEVASGAESGTGVDAQSSTNANHKASAAAAVRRALVPQQVCTALIAAIDLTHERDDGDAALPAMHCALMLLSERRRLALSALFCIAGKLMLDKPPMPPAASALVPLVRLLISRQSRAALPLSSLLRAFEICIARFSVLCASGALFDFRPTFTASMRSMLQDAQQRHSGESPGTIMFISCFHHSAFVV